jgi:hypothetical protein
MEYIILGIYIIVLRTSDYLKIRVIDFLMPENPAVPRDIGSIWVQNLISSI